MFVPFLVLFASGNSNTVLKSASKATAALNGLPCLLLEGDRRAERLALFALEAAEDTRLPVCQQVGHFRVCERPARYLAEHRQGAVRVVAAHHFAVELHRARVSQRTTLP